MTASRCSTRRARRRPTKPARRTGRARRCPRPAHGDDVARLQAAGVAQVHLAVDLRSIGLGAAGRAAGFPVDGVDQHLDHRADLARELLGGDARGQRHHPLEALLLDVGGNLAVHRGCGRALDRLELERADAVELRFLEPGEEIGDVLVGLAGEAEHEGRADREVGNLLAPGADALQHFRVIGRAPHRAQHVRARVLERDVEIREHQPLGHQRNDIVDVGVGVDVVQPHPGARACRARAQDRSCGRGPRVFVGVPAFHGHALWRMSTP